MKKILTWIKENTLSSILLTILIIILLKGMFGSVLFNRSLNFGTQLKTSTPDLSLSTAPNRMGGLTVPTYESAPQLDVDNRMVVKNSIISIVVEDVNKTIETVSSYADSIGGYMVNSSVIKPEGLSKGSLSIRVPTDKLDETLTYLDEKAVKVVSKEVMGRDVTDQYIDIEERITTLENSKTRYETLLQSVSDAEQILQITNNIVNLQERIDSLKGRQQYLEQTSATALIRINLATTELELPYSPENPWQPKVVFKYAVRTLVGLARAVATLTIWVGVFSIIWGPVVAYIIYRKRKKSKK